MERMKRVKPEATCKTPNAKTKTDLNVLKHKLRKPRIFSFHSSPSWDWLSVLDNAGKSRKSYSKLSHLNAVNWFRKKFRKNFMDRDHLFSIFIFASCTRKFTYVLNEWSHSRQEPKCTSEAVWILTIFCSNARKCRLEKVHKFIFTRWEF